MTVLGGGIVAATSGVTLSEDADDEHERRAVLAIITAAGVHGANVDAIGAVANLDATRVKLQLGELIAHGQARLLAKPTAYIAATLADDVLARTIDVLAQRQRERPWVMGSTSLALAQRLALPEAALVRVLATYVDAGALIYRGGYYATIDFQPKLTAEQRGFFDAAFAPAPGGESMPIAFEQLKAMIRASRVADVSAAFETLVTTGALTRVGEFVYVGSQLRMIRGQLEAALRAQNHITVAEFRTLTGTSRKYAVPLLEFFDATGVTLRTGDLRVLRRTTPATPAAPASRTATDATPAPP
jgi:selenocysteine-specific elongation factor